MIRERTDISTFLQDQLRARSRHAVPAAEAAKWLDEARLLKDSRSRPGLPLRNLLRANRIDSVEQRPPQPYGRWFIVCQPD